jgi:accessory gene regulator protein AgrB
MTPEDHDKIRARQKSRAMLMGLLLGALVLLFYGITIAKMGGN